MEEHFVIESRGAASCTCICTVSISNIPELQNVIVVGYSDGSVSLYSSWTYRIIHDIQSEGSCHVLGLSSAVLDDTTLLSIENKQHQIMIFSLRPCIDSNDNTIVSNMLWKSCNEMVASFCTATIIVKHDELFLSMVAAVPNSDANQVSIRCFSVDKRGEADSSSLVSRHLLSIQPKLEHDSGSLMVCQVLNTTNVRFPAYLLAFECGCLVVATLEQDAQGVYYSKTFCHIDLRKLFQPSNGEFTPVSSVGCGVTASGKFNIAIGFTSSPTRHRPLLALAKLTLTDALTSDVTRPRLSFVDFLPLEVDYIIGGSRDTGLSANVAVSAIYFDKRQPYLLYVGVWGGSLCWLDIRHCELVRCNELLTSTVSHLTGYQGKECDYLVTYCEDSFVTIWRNDVK